MGFNLFEALWVSIEKDKAGVGKGYETIGLYCHLSVGNLLVFLIGIGVPMTTAWIRQVVRAIHQSWGYALLNKNRLPPDNASTFQNVYVIGYFISSPAIAFSTLFTMAVERVWIFMAPFIVIPVAEYLHDFCNYQQNWSAFYWVVGLLCAQLILFEITLYTYW